MDNEQSTKEYNELIFLDILKLLRTKQSRLARKIIYHAYIDYKFNNKLQVFNDEQIKMNADLLKGDFDEIGFLIEFNYINKFHFFSLYSDVVRRVWISLEEEIKKERNLRKNTNLNSNKTDIFLEYFEKLADYAKNFRDQKGLSEPLFTDYRNSLTHDVHKLR